MSEVQAVLLGATGYVGGELLRLLAAHPRLRLSAAVSGSRAGERVAAVFPHLALAYPQTVFSRLEDTAPLLEGSAPVAVFGALPHGETAERLAPWAEAGDRVRIVDISADFRIADPAVYARIYGKPHGAPGLLERFFCGIPEISKSVRPAHVAHPGCFTTCVTLGAAPLVAKGLAEPRFFVSAVTGSTGSGREPSAGTHHPERHGNLRAYSPLGHRHEVEMRAILGAAAGAPVDVVFVPHSGPFARGIHATLHARLRRPMTTQELLAAFRDYYADCPFVGVLDVPPTLKEIVGSNRSALSVVARGDEVVVLATIDNLVKGAARGAVQWMNRLFGWKETDGLLSPALGWN